MAAEVIKIDPNNIDNARIEKAACYIRQGKLAAIPIGGCYMIAGDFANQEVLKSLRRDKNPKGGSLNVAVADKKAIERLSSGAPILAYKLADKFWPGALTMVLSGSNNKTIALIMPKDEIALRIIKASAVDLAVYPAAINTQGSLGYLNGVLARSGDKVDFIIDADSLLKGPEPTVIDLSSGQFNISHQGAVSRDLLEQAVRTKRVVFVCTGNSCRSVMAEGLLKKAVKDKRMADIEVLSAGITAINGLLPTAETVELLTKEGIDMSGHRSRRIDNILLKSADIILTMEKFQEERILADVPEIKNRLYLLKEFAKICHGPQDLDIADPIGQGKGFYANTFFTIKEAVNKIVGLI